MPKTGRPKVLPLRAPTKGSERYLLEWAEFGFGYEVQAEFNKKHGFGVLAHKTYCCDIAGFRKRFYEIRDRHEERKTLEGRKMGPLPAGHTQELSVWQQNFLESYRRTSRALGAAEKAGVSWAEVKECLETQENFQHAYQQVDAELIQGLRDQLMVEAKAGKIPALSRLLKTTQLKSGDEEEGNWWEDETLVADAYH